MHPVLFRIGPVNIYSFGLMLSLGFALAVLVSFFNAKRHGVDRWVVVDMALWLFLAGLLGSRLLYVVMNWDDYAGGPFWRVFATWEGGVSFFGAIAGGFLAVAVFARRHRLSLARIADTVAPGLALAAAVGRIGCALNGCCYGLPASGFWGVFTRFAPGLRHPTQLYESAAYFVTFGFLLWWQGRRERAPGQVFTMFVLCYLAGRFLVEFFREGQRLYPWLTVTQAAALVVAAAAVAAYIHLGRRARRTRTREGADREPSGDPAEASPPSETEATEA